MLIQDQGPINCNAIELAKCFKYLNLFFQLWWQVKKNRAGWSWLPKELRELPCDSFMGKKTKSSVWLTMYLLALITLWNSVSPRYKFNFLFSTYPNLTSKKSVTRMVNAVSYLEMGHWRKRIACPALTLANFRTLSMTSSPFYIGYWFPICFFY